VIQHSRVNIQTVQNDAKFTLKSSRCLFFSNFDEFLRALYMFVLFDGDSEAEAHELSYLDCGVSDAFSEKLLY